MLEAAVCFTPAGTIFKDELYMADYRGTKLYFYGRRKRDFDQILGSIAFTQSAGIL